MCFRRSLVLAKHRRLAGWRKTKRALGFAGLLRSNDESADACTCRGRCASASLGAGRCRETPRARARSGRGARSRVGIRDSGGAGGARARARAAAHLDRTTSGRSAACDMPMDLEEERIVDDLHARGWDERGPRDKRGSWRGSVSLRTGSIPSRWCSALDRWHRQGAGWG